MSTLERLKELEVKLRDPFRQDDADMEGRIADLLDSLPKLLAFIDAYDHWLYMLHENNPSIESLELAVNRLDAARKALDEL